MSESNSKSVYALVGVLHGHGEKHMINVNSIYHGLVKVQKQMHL